jgi:hypothetical protein
MARPSRVFPLGAVLLSCLVFGAVPPPAVAAPANDNFEHAAPIRIGQTITATTAGASVQPGERAHLADYQRSVWYRVRSRREVAVALSTCGTKIDTVVAVYTGRTLGSLRAVEFNNDGCASDAGSRVTFTAKAGRVYRIAVSSVHVDPQSEERAAGGRFSLRARSVKVPANDDFANAARVRLGGSVAGTTRNATRELWEPAHSGQGPATVWFRFTVPTAREVRVGACSGSYPEVTVYTGRRVSRLSLVATSYRCSARFAARAGVSYRVAVDGYQDRTAFRLAARRATPPANDHFASASPVTLGTTTPGTFRDATREPDEPGTPWYAPFTVWFTISVSEPTTIALDASGPTYSTWSIFTGDELHDLTPLGGGGFTTDFAATPGVVYYIQVQSENDYDSEGDFTFRARARSTP